MTVVSAFLIIEHRAENALLLTLIDALRQMKLTPCPFKNLGRTLATRVVQSVLWPCGARC